MTPALVVPVLFVIAAACGAMLRTAANIVAGDRWRVPIGTLSVNWVGALGLGVVSSWDRPAATIVGTAGLGALTTFSTMAGEIVELWEQDPPAAQAYGLLTVVGGIALAWIGLIVA